MNIQSLVDLRIDAEFTRMPFEIRKRRLRRLLHNFTDLPGDLHAALAFQDQHLDRHNLAAVLRPCHGSGNANLVLALGFGLEELRRAEELFDVQRGQPVRVVLILRLQAGYFAAHAANLAFEVAHAGFIGVFTNDPADGRVLELHLFFFQPALFHLARQQVAVGDLEFFFFDIAGELDDFHAVQQRRRDRSQRIGSGDEHHARQVVR